MNNTLGHLLDDDTLDIFKDNTEIRIYIGKETTPTIWFYNLCSLYSVSYVDLYRNYKIVEFRYYVYKNLIILKCEV